MAKIIREAGYVVRMRVRQQKKRKRVNGRARGFYEGEYVYLRVIGPDQVVRDLYLGTSTRSATSAKKAGGEVRGARAAAATSPARPREGEKAGGDWLDNDRPPLRRVRKHLW